MVGVSPAATSAVGLARQNMAANPDSVPISIVLAISKNRVIGTTERNGKEESYGGMPWKLPEDLKNFRKITMGKPVIMGRCTWETLPERPLERRKCIVLTNRTDFTDHERCTTAKSPEDALEIALELCANATEIMVVGGARVFKAFWPLCEKLYLTSIVGEVKGDVCLEEWGEGEWDLSKFVLTHEAFHPADHQHHYAFKYQEFELGRRRC